MTYSDARLIFSKFLDYAAFIALISALLISYALPIILIFLSKDLALKYKFLWGGLALGSGVPVLILFTLSPWLIPNVSFNLAITVFIFLGIFVAPWGIYSLYRRGFKSHAS